MNLENELNRRENRIILKVMELIYEERRAFTSGKYLLTKLNENGYRFNKSRIMPYINWMIEEGVLEKSNCSVKPYIIIMTREKIRNKLENWRLTI